MRAVPPSLARADLILADSESTRRDLVELLSVDPSRIRVIYPAVDPTFRPSDAACVQGVRELYAIGEQSYILSVGTLQPRKNYVRLLQAFAQIRRDSGLPHHLVIAGGPGWLYEPIYQAIQDLALGDSVHLLGYVDEGDLPALYTGAELFAFPSLYEGFGFPVLEAMACGTPVVSADSSSLPEAAGQAALLVPPTDTMALAEAMGRVLSESHTRAELIRRGYLQCRRFRWEDAARSLLTSYIETLNGETHV